jgi:hypothetical protein
MNVRRRPATVGELASKYRNLSWFQGAQRRLARAEASAGLVEDLSFDVTRAWKLFSCAGAPCCPHSWLLQSDAGDFIQLDSWTALRPNAVDDFPGRHVIATRWPESERLIDVAVSGDRVPSELPTPQNFVELARHGSQCHVMARDELPEELRALVGGEVRPPA